MAGCQLTGLSGVVQISYGTRSLNPGPASSPTRGASEMPSSNPESGEMPIQASAPDETTAIPQRRHTHNFRFSLIPPPEVAITGGVGIKPFAHGRDRKST